MGVVWRSLPGEGKGWGSDGGRAGASSQGLGSPALLPPPAPRTAWFVTTSRTKLMPSGRGICTPRQVRSVGGSSRLSRGLPSSPPTPPLLPPPVPSPTVEHGHHPDLQHGPQRGLQRDQLVGKRGRECSVGGGPAWTAHPTPGPPTILNSLPETPVQTGSSRFGTCGEVSARWP